MLSDMLRGMMPVAFLAVLFFIGKTYIVYDKLKTIKYENKIKKGKVVKLTETRDIGPEVIYIYSIETCIDSTKKCYTYYEIVSKNKESKLKIGMQLDVYFSEEPPKKKAVYFTDEISLLKDLKEVFWSSLILLGVFVAVLLLLSLGILYADLLL